MRRSLIALVLALLLFGPARPPVVHAQASGAELASRIKERYNNRVGIYGTSYPGFYSSASCLSRHPALVACSPQAPMTDIWMGDDNFHGGAFLLAHNFSFYTRFGRTPRAAPGPDASYPFSMGT